MYYGKLFFQILIYGSLISLIGVFIFQVWAFVKDLKNKDL